MRGEEDSRQMAGPAFDVATIDGTSTLWVDSRRIDACVKYYFTHHIDVLAVNPERGYKAKDIEFLREYPDITRLEILSPRAFKYDLAPISTLHGLRGLRLQEAVPLRLAQFARLEEFDGEWHPKLDLAGSKLKRLSLRGYKSSSGDIDELPEIGSLVDFGLSQSAVTAIRSISRFQRLRRVRLSHLAKLGALSGVERLLALEVLECHTCRKLSGYDKLSALKHLQRLLLNNCGDIPSLAFLNLMKNLDEFRFVGTNVVDGDLAPLLRLKRVGFLAKKQYSHTPEQLDAILRPKGGRAVVRDDDPAPVPWRA
jgi:protein phosphatase 1 regulatory subunit 7